MSGKSGDRFSDKDMRQQIPSAEAPREVYFEFTAIGGSVKVVAIDAATGIEVSVIGPSSASQSDLERLALGKLRARLAKDAR